MPLNAVGARSELEMDLKGCKADLVIGPHAGLIPDDSAFARAEGKKEKPHHYYVAGTTDIDSAEFLAFDYVREIALQLGIPFVYLKLAHNILKAHIFEIHFRNLMFHLMCLQFHIDAFHIDKHLH